MLSDEPRGGGQIGALLRSRETSLGPPQRWSPTLRSLVPVVLHNRLPMALWWGDALLQLHNDSCRALLPSRYASALFAPAAEIWASHWDSLGPVAARVLREGASECTPPIPLGANGAGPRNAPSHRFSCSPVLNASGSINGVLVTLLEQPQEPGHAARTAELERLLEEAPIAIATLEGPDHRIAFLNFYARQMLQLAPERAVRGLPLGQVVPELRNPEVVAALDAVQRAGQQLILQERALAPRTPEPRYFNLFLSPTHHEDGASRGVFCLAYDVTEQMGARQDRERLLSERERLLASEQQARADAEAANRAKDEFLAMLGHELRNPLSPILTALELMHLRGENSREKAVIERQVGHLVRLVDDLLDVSRITRGKIELRRTPVELHTIVTRAVEIASPLLEQRHQALQLSVPESDLIVHADTDRLAQVVSNLLTNASKYSEIGAQIWVSARARGDRVSLSVRDEGIGIAPDMLHSVFNAFVQHRQSIDRASGGLGLGLAIVQNLVTLHGGRVEARSEGPGRGSEFIVELPLAAATSRPSRPPRASEEALRARRSQADFPILVVDDNEDAADILAEALRRLGYDASVAHDGPSALELAARVRPVVALLDIGLPVMDGYELAQRLLAQPERRPELRLIAVTGYGQPTDRQRTAEAGFSLHLVKPVSIEQLTDAVRAVGAAPR